MQIDGDFGVILQQRFVRPQRQHLQEGGELLDILKMRGRTDGWKREKEK